MARQRTPEHRAADRVRHYRRKFGLEMDELERRAALQDHKCAICGERRKLVVDHCHTSGQVRGLLCDPCNRHLGGFRDDPALLRAAACYVESWIGGRED